MANVEQTKASQFCVTSRPIMPPPLSITRRKPENILLLYLISIGQNH